MSEPLTPAPINETRTVARGRKAWATIQISQRVMRREWQALGRALLIGGREHPDSDSFGRWCSAHDLLGIPALAQTGAEEFAKAAESRVIQGTVPVGIREWYRDRAIKLGTQRIHRLDRDTGATKPPKSPGTRKRIKPMDDEALITRGQAAWARIKESAPARRAISRGSGPAASARRQKSKNEHIQWWREVGEALEVGRNLTALARHGAYGAWLRAKGFGDVPVPSSVIWFAANIETIGEIPGYVTSPSSIRSWVCQRESTKRVPATPAEDMSLQAAVYALRQATAEMKRCVQALSSATRTVECAERELRNVLRLRARKKRKAAHADD